jgi:hypothetical protein
MSHGGEMQQGWISPGEMSCFSVAESHICCTPPQENCTRVAFPPKTISHMLDFSQGGIQQSSNAIPKRRTNLVEIRICSASAMGISQMLVVSKGPPQRNPHMLDAPPQENPDVMSPPHSNSQIWGSPLGRYARMEFPIATTIMKGFLGKRHHPAMNQIAIPLQLRYEQLA